MNSESVSFLLQKIKSQGVGYDPETRMLPPHGELIFATFTQAVLDALTMRNAAIRGPANYGMSVQDMASGVTYIGSDQITALECLSIDSDWARKTLSRAGIGFSQEQRDNG